jgi:flagellar hook-associated protein 1 FlgK
MPNLLAMLGSTGGALDVYQQALSIAQNNISNASTPGYASQSLNLEAMPVDTNSCLGGGLQSAGLDNSRDQYAEEQVQRQTQTLGQFTAQAQTTDSIQTLFDASGSSGVAANLTSLFQSFSAWSVNPNDATAQQTVINSATTVAASIQTLADSLSQNAQQLDGSIASTTSQINTIAKQIQAYNAVRVTETTADPGQDAQLYSSLDNLSQLTNFSAVTQADGTVTVLLGGGSPLVIGQQQYSIGASSSPSGDEILDSQGNDITSQIASGQLGGMLDTRNRVLGAMIGDGQQPGTFNQFATTLANSVNQILETGTVSGGAAGQPLFVYNAPTGSAATLAVNSALSPGQLAPVDSSGNANGNPNQLAALENSGLPQLGGMRLTQYFGQIASYIGNENQTATDNQTSQQQVVAQATSLVNQVSGVSLDDQAVDVLQFQRAYQACAQVLTTVNNLCDTLMNLIQPNA